MFYPRFSNLVSIFNHELSMWFLTLLLNLDPDYKDYYELNLTEAETFLK